ncbi:hypothetical protein BH11BAC3_BH11BAC3_00920 [soil metagenome]
MEINKAPGKAVVFEAATHHPSVSVFMPFEPKMTSKQYLRQMLEAAIKKVEQQMLHHYSYKEILGIRQKLKKVIAELNYNTHKKSIAIYVSPLFEKVLYLDICVEEKVIVSNTFEIRNLVNSKSDLHEYLLLHLGTNAINIYHGNSNGLVKIVSNNRSHFLQNELESTEVGSLPVASQFAIITSNYLRHVDQSLNIVLNAYPFPLFIVGAEEILTSFKDVTKHANTVIDYVPVDFEVTDYSDLAKILTPHISDWHKIKQKEITNKLVEAAVNKKLAVGMKAVWQKATSHRGRLLIIEKNYEYKADQENNNEMIAQAVGRYNKYSNIKDAVDDVIEKVLEDGGDVEFVENDLLNEYQHIALVEYY